MTRIEVEGDTDHANMKGLITSRQMPGPGIINVNESSDLAESLRELNNDNINDKTKMSGIDLRSRLHPIELSSILVIDTLVGMNVFPNTALILTTQKKRLSVSLGGMGRKEIVNIVVGNREQEMIKKQGLGARIANVFTGGKKNIENQ